MCESLKDAEKKGREEDWVKETERGERDAEERGMLRI